MTKLKLVLFAIVSCVVSNSFGLTVAELCRYDKFCSQLRGDNGNIKVPDQALVSTLTKLRPQIYAAAQTYGVDPRAIAGAILTENSLNVGITDEVEDLLVNLKIAKNGSIGGRTFTYGLGQLNCQVVQSANNYASKNNIGQPHPDICSEIKRPEGSVMGVAMVLRQAQDIYKQHGVDISKDPGLLCTLYNLGKVDQRAANLKPGYVPKVNYFGWYVNYQMGEINTILGPAPVATTGTPAPAAPVDYVSTLKSETSLNTAPPLCATSGTSRIPAISSKTEKVKGGLAYEIVGHAVDCQLKGWSMIRILPDGQVGWISNAVLQAESAKAIVKKQPECDESNPACVTAVLQSEKRNLIDRDPDEATALMQISGYNGTNVSRSKISENDFSSDCLRPRPDGLRKLTADEISKLKSAFVDYQKEQPLRKNYYYGNNGPPTAVDNAFHVFEDLYYCGDNCYALDSDVKGFLANPKKVPTNPLVYIGPSDLKASNNDVAAGSPAKNPTAKQGSYQQIVNNLSDCSRNLHYVQYGNNAMVKDTPTVTAANTVGNSRLLLTKAVPAGVRYDYNRVNVLNINLKNSPDLSKIVSFCDKLAAFTKTQKPADVNYFTDVYQKNLNEFVLKNGGDQLDVPDDMEKLFPSIACSYDANQTYLRLGAILESDCVERVYIQDAAVFEVLTAKYPGRVAYQPAVKGDRFKVEFKKTCTDIALVAPPSAAPAGAPGKPGKVRK